MAAYCYDANLKCDYLIIHRNRWGVTPPDRLAELLSEPDTAYIRAGVVALREWSELLREAPSLLERGDVGRHWAVLLTSPPASRGQRPWMVKELYIRGNREPMAFQLWDHAGPVLEARLLVPWSRIANVRPVGTLIEAGWIPYQAARSSIFGARTHDEAPAIHRFLIRSDKVDLSWSPTAGHSSWRDLNLNEDGSVHPWDPLFNGWIRSKRGNIFVFGNLDCVLQLRRMTEPTRWTAKMQKGAQTLYLDAIELDVDATRCHDKYWDWKRASLRPHSVGPELSVINAADGIGDAVVALYACCGLAATGVDVRFFTDQSHWFWFVRQTRLTISPRRLLDGDNQLRSPIDLCENYDHHLRFAKTRLAWYCDALGRQLQPVRPTLSLVDAVRTVPFENYIILAPYSHWRAREWPFSHWRRLCEILVESNFDLIVLVSPKDETRARSDFTDTTARWIVGDDPRSVVAALLHAACVVGNDSGMTHLAGLLGCQVVAIHAHLSSEFLWDFTSVVGLTPSTRCACCAWRSDLGFREVCDSGCSALGSIMPERVAAEVLRLVR